LPKSLFYLLPNIHYTQGT